MFNYNIILYTVYRNTSRNELSITMVMMFTRNGQFNIFNLSLGKIVSNLNMREMYFYVFVYVMVYIYNLISF